ncbi:heavy-metal-associated domain-containing protein [Kitasatospora nipponensis]|uniref:Heavy-metal-associated domain-containing protein n=2 Tax=Kitasatospora nipponensis TaxID=258049 RepID=A0ABN1VPV4_9ACTN
MSCCGTEGTCSTTQAPEAGSAALTTVYEVQGMTCGHCKEAVTKAVTALDGVTGVEVDVATGRVTVGSTYALDDAAVRGAVDDAGYELVGRA